MNKHGHKVKANALYISHTRSNDILEVSGVYGKWAQVSLRNKNEVSWSNVDNLIPYVRAEHE